MNKFLTSLCIIVLSLISIYTLESQTTDVKVALLKEKRDTVQAQADRYQAQIDSITDSQKSVIPWDKGFSGLIGFDFFNSDNWKNNPNPDVSSSSLNLLITAFLYNSKDEFFWRNKIIINKGWSDVDLNTNGSPDESDGLFDNGTVDLLNFSSIYGHKLSETLALSSLGEINSSLENFFNPGTIDLGIGATWTPFTHLVVTLNAFNYHLAYSGNPGISSEAFLGAKLRADFTHSLNKMIKLTSVLSSFIPYGDSGSDEKTDLFEYTWINTFSIEFWKNIGFGFSLGIRKANFESQNAQSYYSFGLSYSF